ncbi:hypothetical protein GQ457_17G008030 [Hibiscus cannabinus]
MVTYWAVWYTRNQVVHEGIVHSNHNTLSFVVAFLREHDMFNPLACLRPLRSHGSWSTPVSDVIKVNFDASFDVSVGKSVSGVVCRDSEGLILAACCYPHSYVTDPFQAEALACLVAIGFTRDLGFAKVLLEGDSLTIIKNCSSEANDISLISPMIADIKEVAKSFQQISFTFAYREANVAAHTLAHEGKAFSSPIYWIEDAPPRTLLAAEKGTPCGQQNIWLLCLFCNFVCSTPQNAIAFLLPWVFPLVKRRLAQKSTSSLPSQSLYLHTCTSPPNNTFLKQYQPSTNKKVGNKHPCTNAN